MPRDVVKEAEVFNGVIHLNVSQVEISVIELAEGSVGGSEVRIPKEEDIFARSPSLL